jgi:hypothetical protein
MKKRLTPPVFAVSAAVWTGTIPSATRGNNAVGCISPPLILCTSEQKLLDSCALASSEPIGVRHGRHGWASYWGSTRAVCVSRPVVANPGCKRTIRDPEAEAAFLAAGHGINRIEIAWNDFIIVGPEADPAHVAGRANATDALKAIAATGTPFVSRGDNSGTDAEEKRLWRAAGIAPSSSWYREIGGGMGAALNAASAVGAYILSDRGTWISYGNKRGMKIVLEGAIRTC